MCIIRGKKESEKKKTVNCLTGLMRYSCGTMYSHYIIQVSGYSPCMRVLLLVLLILSLKLQQFQTKNHKITTLTVLQPASLHETTKHHRQWQ